MNNRNYKEQFQKVYQSLYHITPTYRLVKYENGLYTMAIDGQNGVCLGQGTAPTKKQAEQFAAKEALKS
jgi:dsRNA-specific ribonuclease